MVLFSLLRGFWILFQENICTKIYVLCTRVVKIKSNWKQSLEFNLSITVIESLSKISLRIE